MDPSSQRLRSAYKPRAYNGPRPCPLTHGRVIHQAHKRASSLAPTRAELDVYIRRRFTTVLRPKGAPLSYRPPTSSRKTPIRRRRTARRKSGLKIRYNIRGLTPGIPPLEGSRVGEAPKQTHDDAN